MKGFTMEAKGRLFYLIGPSGAGKDSLISYARQRLDGEAAIVFAHRYITRPPLANDENHIALSENEFQARLEKGFFAMHWRSHGFCYGIGIEIDLWLARQCDVVVNGSRSYLPNAMDLYPDLRVILLDVSDGQLKYRLQTRGRETGKEVRTRLHHNHQLKAALLENVEDISIINNDGPLESAGDRFVKQLSL